MENPNNSSDSSWAWGFNDLVLIAFTVLLILTILMAKDYNPTVPQIAEGTPNIDSLQAKCDSLQRVVDSFGGKNGIPTRPTAGICQLPPPPPPPSPPKVDIPFPLTLSINWNNKNVKVRMYVKNQKNGEIVYHSFFYRNATWGSIWPKGLDIVPDPDIAFVQQDSLVAGKYDVYLHTNGPISTQVEGFIWFKSPSGQRQKIEIPPLHVENSPPPWNKNGEPSIFGTLVVENNKISWSSKK